MSVEVSVQYTGGLIIGYTQHSDGRQSPWRRMVQRAPLTNLEAGFTLRCCSGCGKAIAHYDPDYMIIDEQVFHNECEPKDEWVQDMSGPYVPGTDIPITFRMTQYPYRFTNYEDAKEFMQTGDQSLAVPWYIGVRGRYGLKLIINPAWKDAPFEHRVFYTPGPEGAHITWRTKREPRTCSHGAAESTADS